MRAHAGSFVPGASGLLTAVQVGRVRRVLIWAKFQDGLAHPLGGSLQMDDMPSNAPPANPSSSSNGNPPEFSQPESH